METTLEWAWPGISGWWEPAEEPAVSIAGNLPSVAKKSHPQGGDVVQNLIGSHIRDAWERSFKGRGLTNSTPSWRYWGRRRGSCRPRVLQVSPCCRDQDLETPPSAEASPRDAVLCRGCSLERATPHRRLKETAPAGEEQWVQCMLQDQQKPLEPGRGKNPFFLSAPPNPSTDKA